MPIKVDVEWQWSRQGQWIKIATIARASNGWVAHTNRLYRREPEDENKSDAELGLEQAYKAADDVKERFGAENNNLLPDGLDLIETGKNAIQSSRETSQSSS